MSLIISDSFALYNDTASALMMKNWTSSSIGFLNPGRWGTGSYSISTSTGFGYLFQNVSLSGSTTIVGFAIKPFLATDGSFFRLYNGTNTVAIKVNTSSQIVVYNPSNNFIYHTVSSPIAINTTWYYLEIKVAWSATAGQIIFKIDGSQYYDSGTTLNLGSSSNTTQVTLGSAGNQSRCYITDLLVMDGTGTTYNDFQGDVRIETLNPSGDGANQDWSLPNNTLLTSANQARITTDTSGWTSTGTVTLNRSTSSPEPKIMTNSLQISTSSAGWTVISSPNGVSGYAVTPGQTLALGCWLAISSSYNIGLYARFYDGSGAQLGADLAFTTGFNTNSSWLFLNTFGAITVPPSAATCGLVLKSAQFSTFFTITGIVLSTDSTTPTYVEPGGQHFASVGELTHNSDLTYITTGTVNAKETYAMSDLQSSSGNILSVRQVAVARKENAATQTLATVTRVGSTDYNGVTQGLPNNLTYQQQNDLYIINPATSAAWTRSEVNSLEAGVELKS